MRYFLLMLFLSLFVFKTSLAIEDINKNINNWSIQKNFKIEVENSGFLLPTAMSFVNDNNNLPENVNYYVLELGGNLKAVLNNKKVIDYANDLIPNNFKNGSNYKKTGIAGIFAGSLELVKEGNLTIKQKNLFDKIYIKEIK